MKTVSTLIVGMALLVAVVGCSKPAAPVTPPAAITKPNTGKTSQAGMSPKPMAGPGANTDKFGGQATH